MSDQAPRDATSGVEHSRRMLALTERLAAQGIAVYEHQWFCLMFGSWTLIAGTRHRRFRFQWDGKEFFIDVQVAEFGSSGDKPVWHAVTNERLAPDIGSDPLTFVETFFATNRNI